MLGKSTQPPSSSRRPSRRRTRENSGSGWVPNPTRSPVALTAVPRTSTRSPTLRWTAINSLFPPHRSEPKLDGGASEKVHGSPTTRTGPDPVKGPRSLDDCSALPSLRQSAGFAATGLRRRLELSSVEDRKWLTTRAAVATTVRPATASTASFDPARRASNVGTPTPSPYRRPISLSMDEVGGTATVIARPTAGEVPPHSVLPESADRRRHADVGQPGGTWQCT